MLTKNKNCMLTVLILILNVFLFSILNAELEVKTDKNGYSYEMVKDNENLGRLYKLSNGLKIYMVQNKLHPVIETRIVVGAGSKYDPDDNTGLAHYLEHMLFKGNEKIGTVNWKAEKPYIEKITDLYEKHKKAKTQKEKDEIYEKIDELSYEAAQYAAPNELDVIIKSMGGKKYNAYTNSDQTAYILEIPSNELEKWIKLERIRFGSLVLRLFHTELETVYEEFNQNQDNDFFWVLSDINKRLYSGHPYGEKTTIGRAKDLKNPSMAAIMDFYNKYYVANNMAIILSGDLDYDNTIKLIDNYWGDFKKNNELKFEDFSAKDFNQTVIDVVKGGQTEFVAVAFRTAGEVNLSDSVRLGLLAEILQNDKAGLIDVNILQKQKVLSIEKLIMSNRDYTSLILLGVPKADQSLEEVKDIILEEIENLKKGNYSDDLIQSVKNNVELGRELAKDNNNYLTDRFNNLFINNKNIDMILQADREFDSLTKNDMIKFANDNFKENYVVVYKKNGKNTLKASVEKPKITPLELNNRNRSKYAEEIINEKTKNIVPKFVDFKKDMQSFILPNKNEVFYIKNNTSDIFKLAYIIDRGLYNDRELRIALDYINYLGADQYTPEEFGEILYKKALNISIDVNSENVTIVLSGLDKSFQDGLAILQDYMLNVKADDNIYKNYAEDIIKGRYEMQKNKRTAMNGITNYAVYGSENPFNNNLSNEEIRNINPEELVKKVHDLLEYKHEVFYYGPKNIKDLKTPLNNIFEVKKPKVEKAEVKYKELDISENKIYYADYESIQNDIMILSKEKKFTLETLPYSMLFTTLYSDGLSSIPFQKLREGKGLAYSAYSYMKVPDNLNNSFYLISYVGTQSDKTDDAISSFMELLNNFTVTKDQFNDAKGLVLKNIENKRIINDDIYQAYLGNKKLGLKEDPRKYVYNKIKNMTYEEFRSFFIQNISNQKYTMLVTGRKENILNSGLEKYGTLTELKPEEIFGY